MGHYVRDEGAIRNCKKEIEKYENKLKDCEDDYTILVDQQLIVAQLYSICENNEYLTRALDSSISYMYELGTRDVVPSFKEVFDFDDLRANGSLISQFSKTNNDTLDEFKTAGEKIDALKEEVANNVLECKMRLDQLATQLNILENSYNIWVED